MGEGSRERVGGGRENGRGGVIRKYSEGGWHRW